MLRRCARPLLLLALALLLVPRIADAEVLDDVYGSDGIASGELSGDRLPVEGTYAVGDGVGRMVVIDRQGPMDGDVRLSRVTRVTAAGSPDTDFGEDGDAVLPSGFWPLLPSAVAGHGLAIWGILDTGDERVDAVLRLTEDGEIDTRFNGGQPFVPAGNQHVNTGFLGDDGSLVLFVFGAEPRPQLVVYGEDGLLDQEFGGDGSVDAEGWPVARDVERRTTYIVSGCSAGGECSSYRRLLPNGIIDQTFGDDGTAVVPGTTYGAPSALLGSEDGSVLYLPTTTSGQVGVTRLLNGSVDTTFGADGTAQLPLESETVSLDRILMAPLSGGGLAIAVGLVYSSGPADPQAMAVLTADGELDQRFGIGGVRTTTGNRVIGLATSPLTDLLVARVADAGHTEVAALELVEAPIITGVTGRPAAVSVEWHVPPGLAAETVLYEVLAVSDGAVTGYALVAGDVRSVSLTGLHGDDHAISVRPISRTGYGRSSDPVMAATDAGGPAATPPAQPTLAGVWEGSGPTQDRVRVAWTPAADNGAPIVAYSVAAFDAHTGEILSFRSLGADARSAIVPNLRFGRRAEVWVFAWNAQGMGDVTKVEVNPGNDLPLSTAGPWLPWAAAWRVSGSTYVTWGAAFEGHEPVAGYDVLLLVDGAFRGWYQTGPDARQLVLPLIPADEHAQVYVTAHGATSLGPLGDPITVTGGLG